ncbi:MAG: DUF3662 domain-containing protein [Actinobacteria bacterium]|nr:DUF3662 domain-containing protein [Actinomycetota bacterium]
MAQVLVLLLGVVAGFGGARLLRRPSTAGVAGSAARSAASAVGGRRGLDPVQLQRATFAEMVRHVTVGGRGVHVPDRYTVSLHPADLATVQQAPGWFRSGLEDALRRAARDNGWPVPPRLSIDVVGGPSRRPGAPAVHVPGAPPVAPAHGPPVAPARAVADGPTRFVGAATSGPRLERIGSGEAPFALDSAEVTIGRGADRRVRIDDDRVSRRHALVRLERTGWVLVDEGSSNGTWLDGNRLPAGVAAPLRDGASIGIGPATFVFRAGSTGPADPDATRVEAPEGPGIARTTALDPSQREALSRQYLGDEHR